MSTKPEETYRLAGGITVTDADLEAGAPRGEGGEGGGGGRFPRGPPPLSGIDPR